MADRREFLQNTLVGLGIVGFTAKTKAVFTLLRLAGEPLLPEGWEFYEVNGDVLFPIYAESGGISTRYVCYLMQRCGRQWYTIPIGFTADEVNRSIEDEECKSLCIAKVHEAIKSISPVPVNMNGGALPLPA